LIVTNQGAESFRRGVDALNHTVDVAVVGKLAQAPAARRDVFDRLFERRVGEQPVQ
jgi:hypothetical protein